MTRYLLIALVAGVAALAVAPIAGAEDTPVDDYWRDHAAVSLTSDTIVDDYFRDAPATVTAPLDTIVDDYFRDAPTVVSSNSSFDWTDFGIGAVTATGAMLLLAGLGVAILAVRPRAREKRHSAGVA